MPTTTWETMRQDIVRPLGLVTGTTTTNVAANTSLIDTALTELYSSDDYFNANWYAIVTSNNRDGQYRRVTDYAQSSGTLTVSLAWGAGTDGANSTYELMTLPPNKVMEWYNRARQEVWPHIGIVRDVETVVTGTRQFTYEIPSTIRRVNRVYLGERYEAQNDSENLLLNGSFEDWTNATSPDNWSVTGSGASMNQEEQTTSPTNYAILSGNNSVRLVVPSSTAVTLVQTFDSTLSRYTAVATQGMEASLSAWVYCTLASRVSLTIDGAVQSDTHGGTGWELLTGTQTLTQTDTEAAVGLSITSGAAAAVYVDEIFLTLGQSGPLDRPYTPITNWDVIPPAAGASTGGTLRFTGKVPSHHRLRIVGSDMLSAVTTDASTTEIDGDLLEPLYNKVRQYLCDERASGNPESYWFTMARQFEGAYNRAIESGAVGIRPPRQRFKAPNMAF
tara:strand:+ start:506 stop:1846 length:1341 start_codon:yes stop_codon:yes gene_type:complete